ncbi:hypothetical protein PC116_g9007 [Phytophthora cactorum]|nr:hypothetical protein PC116_g9007 [Phytophthora cactorum]
MSFYTSVFKLSQEWSGIADCQPRMIWSQARSQFLTLADLLVKVYTAPGSTAGVERQHKVAKRVHTAVRNCTGGGKVQEQVAVAHNSVVAKLQLDDKASSLRSG